MIDSESRYRLYLLAFLAINLIIKLLFYYNTTAFDIAEAKSNFTFLRAIERGESLGFFLDNFRSILAYIGYFFKATFGSLGAFYWLQALLATCSVYLLFLICQLLTSRMAASLFAVFLATIFVDYHLLTPVFYYQIFEIFIVFVVLYLVLLIIDERKIMKTAGVLLIPAVVYLSIFFRSTLIYFWLLLIVLSVLVLLRKDYRLAVRLALNGILILLLFDLLPLSHYREVGRPMNNDFTFFGHTLYGGDGGEGSFVYNKNETRYRKKLQQFMIRRNYKEFTNDVRIEFQRNEIREFISRTPHKWLWLQARKVIYTFGIIPARDSLILLTTGKLPLKWSMSAFIIQVPYALILLTFVVLFILFFNMDDLKNFKFLFIILMLFYLIASTCFYGVYQERYRHVVMLGGMIPLAAFYFGKYSDRDSQSSISRKRYFVAAVVLLCIFVSWGYQSYRALVLNKDRYVNALHKFTKHEVVGQDLK